MLNELAIFGKKVILACLLAILPIAPICGTMTFIIITDCILALFAQKKSNGKIPFDPDKFLQTPKKIFMYSLMIITTFLLEHFILEEYMNITKVIAAFLAIKELMSIMGHFKTITGIDIYLFFAEKINEMMPRSSKSIDNKQQTDENNNQKA